MLGAKNCACAWLRAFACQPCARRWAGWARDRAGRKRFPWTNTFTFRLYGLTIVAVQLVAPLLAKIAHYDPDLARQGRRALTSIPLNTAESMDAHGGNKTLRLRTALGSTNETIACLDVAVALGYVARDDRADDALQHVRATLIKCVMRKR